MHIISAAAGLFALWICVADTAALTLPRKHYRDASDASTKNVAGEPTCEELKAMWRFSKRQSRAAEITNEIPMYRDPFSENVWEPYYATSRSMGGMRMGRYKGRPIYGRLVHRPPLLRVQDLTEKNRAFEEVAKMYGNVPGQNEPRRRMTAFRLSGGGHLPPMGMPQSGSFQHLKELIRTERARELQEQRMAEENAARAAALKEIAGARNHPSQANYRDLGYNFDLDGRENHRQSYVGRGGILAFPDLLAPAAARPEPEGPRFIDDYGYTRDRPRSSSFFDTSSFNLDDYEGGLML